MVDRIVQWFLAPELSGSEELILFSACDAGYLDFAVSLIKSVELFSPGGTFFLHIINPDAETYTRLEHLSESLVSTRLYVSLEIIDLSALNLDQKRSYYASARFLQLSKILSSFSTPVFSIDADSLIVNPIDMNFTDKVDADVVIVQRNLTEDQPDHLAIATGSIWLSPSEDVILFLKKIADQIDQGVIERSLEWFVDQRLFYLQMKASAGLLKFYNLNRKYADWKFSSTSIVWAGKGGLKLYDLRFFLLQNLLCDDPKKVNITRHLAAEFFTSDNSLVNEWLNSRIAAALSGRRESFSIISDFNTEESEEQGNKIKTVAFYIPRLDLPWKKMPESAKQYPVVSDDVVDLRLHWKEFALRMSNALERAGVPVEVIELPGWEIERHRIDADAYALAFVPHRCYLNFGAGKTPVLFYMQEFFRWAFVVDARGWSAASSVYPVSQDMITAKKKGASFDDYRARLADGRLCSKFAQQASRSKDVLISEGLIPTQKNWLKQRVLRPYIFFPLQIPTDQSILFFSDSSEASVLAELVAWAKKRDVAVVLKPHPANMKSMKPFAAMVDNVHVFYSEANVKDLIEYAQAVYTINSGVGFEALLQLKPVVTFGRVEYDCVSFNACSNTLDEAWHYVSNVSSKELEEKYRNFVDWFLECYAIDMSQSQATNTRFEEVVETVLEMISQSVRAEDNPQL